MLKISDSLSLPDDAVTQTFAILGVRGSGKTSTATVLTEELLTIAQQVVILDPVDVTWGLRSSASGEKSGFPITILGGDHADLPLEAASGSVVADFVVDCGASLILSLRHLSMADQRRFAADFAEQLYARKGKQEMRQPIHLVVDEADEFCPQRILPGGERLFGAFDRLVRRGRSSGIGLTLISQRPQVVSKDVLSQVETLICHRLLHQLDRRALEAWIEAHDVENRRKEFLDSLASLGRGDAWIWSPEWLGVFERVHVRARNTFDSSSTPKAGEKKPSPKRLAAVDLEALRSQMAAVIERQKADDPKELRRQLAERDKRIRQLESAPAAPRVDVQAEIERAVKTAVAAQEQQFSERLAAFSSGLQAYIRENLPSTNGFHVPPTAPARPSISVPPKPVSPRSPAPAASGVKLQKAERAILTVLAQHGPRTKAQLAILTGYAHSGGGFNNALGALRSSGFITGSDPIEITTDGIAALGSWDPLPTGRDLLQFWMRKEGKAGRTILATLAEMGALTKSALADLCGYAESGGGFNNALSRLRTLELISGKQELRIADELLL